MRADDTRSLEGLRREKPAPEAQVFLQPGNLMVSSVPLALGAVVTSTVAVTVGDPASGHGGMCHFIMPRPPAGRPPTALFGLPAVLALVKELLRSGSSPRDLVAGVYGGACPEWADAHRQQLARQNVEIARDVLERKTIRVADQDVGGNRGRKLWYLAGSDEIVVAKTDAVRRVDWFPPLPPWRDEQ